MQTHIKQEEYDRKIDGITRLEDRWKVFKERFLMGPKEAIDDDFQNKIPNKNGEE